MKRATAFFAAAALAATLTACGGGGVTTFDATNYMQGLMDQTYLGKFSESYMESVGIDEEEAKDSYEQGLEVEYQYFSENFLFDEDYITEETHQATVDLLAEIYQHSRYEIKPATKIEGGFAVEVVIQPVDMIALIAEEYMEEYSDDFAESYSHVTQEDVDAMSEAEAEAFWAEYENAWATGIIDLFYDHMGELGHLDPESIIVQFKPDEDGYYTITDNDFANLDALVLAYAYY